MKINYFNIATKPNTTCYDTVKDHFDKTFYHVVLNKEKAIELNFITELRVEYAADGVDVDVRVASYDVSSLMEWLKENHPEIHALVPPFRIDQLQALGEKMKCETALTLTAVESDQDLEFEFGCEPDTDDFVPERETVEESMDAIRKNGFYTELNAYPDTPVGFWSFYGLDFQSLFDHIVKE